MGGDSAGTKQLRYASDLPAGEPRQSSRSRVQEEGTTTTPFDMTLLNDLDRFHLAGDVVDRTPRLERIGAHFISANSLSIFKTELTIR